MIRGLRVCHQAMGVAVRALEYRAVFLSQGRLPA